MDESARLAVRRQAVRTALQSVRVRLASTDAFLLRARRGEVAASADELASRLGEGRHALRQATELDRKSTRLNSSHPSISYAVFCLKKKKKQKIRQTRE